MKKEGALFDLIKSLTRGEKKFIKVYASRYSVGNTNIYIKLFDAIDKLENYDEEKLKKKLYGSSDSGKLRGVKNYLYFLILDCLDMYHKDSSIDRRISKYINIARVLSEKRLDEQSDKIIERTRKLSDEFDRFENIITLNSLKKNTGFKKETITEGNIQTYFKENFSATDNMNVRLKYSKIYYELLYKRLKIGQVASSVEKQKFKDLYADSYLNQPPEKGFFDANMFFLLAKIEFNRIILDTKSGAIYIRKLIELFDNNVNRIVDNVGHYIYALNVFISERVYENNRSEVDSVIRKILSIPSLAGENVISNDVQVQVFQLYHISSTHIPLVFRDYESAIPGIKKFEIEKNKFEKYFTPNFALCMQLNIACIYFGLGQYKETKKMCNEALSRHLKTRDDAIYVVRVLDLINHYELKNYMILQGLMRSTHRYFQKIQNGNQVVEILLKYMRLLLREESKKEKVSIFTRFKTDLIPLVDNKYENVIFENIDMIGWIDRNIKSLS